MKQFIVILFVAMAFFMVACAKTEDVKPEEGLKEKGRKSCCCCSRQKSEVSNKLINKKGIQLDPFFIILHSCLNFRLQEYMIIVHKFLLSYF